MSKILLMNDSFPPVLDGVANAVVNYAREISNGLGTAWVVTPDCPDADDSGYPFSVYRYPSMDTRKHIGYVTGSPFSPVVQNRIRSLNPDLIHVHCPTVSAVLARQIRCNMELPMVYTYHTKFDIDVANLVKGKLLQDAVIRFIVANISACDEVWTVSRGAGENLRSLGYQGDYLVMENGVDMPRGRADAAAVAAATADYDLPENVPVFLFLGRIMWYKGLRIILDALKIIDDKNLPFRMVFVGDGLDRAEAQEYTRQLGLDKKVFFTGAIRDRQLIRAWYTRADLFLFPSTFDTNGLVVREAAAAYLPSVLIKNSCAAEDVADADTGFLIEENSASMAACLEKLIAQKDFMAQVGRNAADRLYLSWEDAVKKAWDRYQVVIEDFRAGRYPQHKNMSDRFLRDMGVMMNAIGKHRDN